MKGLITRNLHVKYESPTIYGSRDIAKDKVFADGQKEGQTDRQTHIHTDRHGQTKNYMPRIFDRGHKKAFLVFLILCI